MRRVIPYMLALAVLVGPACSEPLKDDQAHNILAPCCDTARERITTVKDVETNRFREYCGMCRQGKSKGDCAHGARRVLQAVAQAYSADMMPLECNTVHAQLKEMGIEFEKPAL